MYSLLSPKTEHQIEISALSEQYYLHYPNLKKENGVGFLLHLFYETVSQSMC